MTKNYSELYTETVEMIGQYAKENPELMGAFSKVHQIGSKDGALKSKHKELIALGISINAQCMGCITMHIKDAMKSGATHNEIVETIGTAIYMGGGPAVVHGTKAYSALLEFEAKVQELAISNN